jgi:hypothetical protein
MCRPIPRVSTVRPRGREPREGYDYRTSDTTGETGSGYEGSSEAVSRELTEPTSHTSPLEGLFVSEWQNPWMPGGRIAWSRSGRCWWLRPLSLGEPHCPPSIEISSPGPTTTVTSQLRPSMPRPETRDPRPEQLCPRPVVRANRLPRQITQEAL